MRPWAEIKVQKASECQISFLLPDSSYSLYVALGSFYYFDLNSTKIQNYRVEERFRDIIGIFFTLEFGQIPCKIKIVVTSPE